tara:strand:+ start:157 stop:1446 length:1290 start_codon:yes stop_codon:yes gene_type:complete
MTSSKISYFVLVSFLSLSLSGESIQYSGISYTSSNEDYKEVFPNTTQLADSLTITISAHLEQNTSLNPNLRLEGSESFKDGSYSIVIGLDHESVTTRNLASQCSRIFRLGIQVIVFNIQDQQVVSITPVSKRYPYLDSLINGGCNSNDKRIELLRFAALFYGIEIQQKDYKKYISLTNNEMIELVKNQSIESNSYIKEDNILGIVINQVLDTKLEDIKNTNFFVGIADVQIGDLAFEQMSGNKEFTKNLTFTDSFGDFQKESYKVWAGQQFSKWFADTFEYPLIPYVKGRALGENITLKFENANEAVNLRLPTLDFGFVINVKGFKKVKLDESKLREAFAWAAFSSIEFHNVGIKKLSEINLKNIQTSEVNKGYSVDDWQKFNIAQNRIMKDYVANLEKLDKKWLKKASKTSTKEFKKHSNLIKKNIRL